MENNNYLSHTIHSKLPQFINELYPKFANFLKDYFTWIQSGGTGYSFISNFIKYHDIDETDIEFVDHFAKTFLIDFPVSIVVDQRTLIKHIREYYSAKGSEKSIKFLFKVLFGEDVDFYYPYYDILIASDGKWTTTTYLKVTGTIDDISLLVGSIITGSTSGAKGIIEYIKTQTTSNGIQYVEIGLKDFDVLHSISEFLPEETVTAESWDGAVQLSAVTYHLCADLSIIDPGVYFQENDPIIIENTRIEDTSADTNTEIMYNGDFTIFDDAWDVSGDGWTFTSGEVSFDGAEASYIEQSVSTDNSYDIHLVTIHVSYIISGNCNIRYGGYISDVNPYITEPGIYTYLIQLSGDSNLKIETSAGANLSIAQITTQNVQQRVVDPSFNNPGAWDNGGVWSLPGNYASCNGQTGKLGQAITGLTAGVVYNIQFEIFSSSAGAVSVTVDSGITGPEVSSSGYHKFTFKADSNNWANFGINSVAFNGSLSHLTITEAHCDLENMNFGRDEFWSTTGGWAIDTTTSTMVATAAGTNTAWNSWVVPSTDYLISIDVDITNGQFAFSVGDYDSDIYTFTDRQVITVRCNSGASNVLLLRSVVSLTAVIHSISIQDQWASSGDPAGSTDGEILMMDNDVINYQFNGLLKEEYINGMWSGWRDESTQLTLVYVSDGQLVLDASYGEDTEIHQSVSVTAGQMYEFSFDLLESPAETKLYIISGISLSGPKIYQEEANFGLGTHTITFKADNDIITFVIITLLDKNVFDNFTLKESQNLIAFSEFNYLSSLWIPSGTVTIHDYNNGGPDVGTVEWITEEGYIQQAALEVGKKYVAYIDVIEFDNLGGNGVLQLHCGSYQGAPMESVDIFVIYFTAGSTVFRIGTRYDQISCKVQNAIVIEMTEVGNGIDAISMVGNTSKGSVDSITIENGGSNYEVGDVIEFTTDNTGTGAQGYVSSINVGAIDGISLISGGLGYSSLPIVSVTSSLGTGAVLIASSQDIGNILTVKMFNTGIGYIPDPIPDEYPAVMNNASVLISIPMVLFNVTGDFIVSEMITGSVSSAIAIVKRYDSFNNNIIIESYSGNFSLSDVITGSISGSTANISSVSLATALPISNAIADTDGFFLNTDGHLSSDKFLQDSYYYQKFSYVITTLTPSDEWIDIIKDTTHPAGTIVFGYDYIQDTHIPVEFGGFVTPHMESVGINKFRDMSTDEYGRTAISQYNDVTIEDMSDIDHESSAFAPGSDITIS